MPTPQDIDTSDVEDTDEREPAKLPPPPIGEQIAAQTPGWTPVSALRGEVSDAGLLSAEVRYLRGEVRDVSAGIKKIDSGLEKLTEQVLAVVTELAGRMTKVESTTADVRKEQLEQRRTMVALGERQNEITERLDRVERAIIAKKRRKAGRK